MKFIIYLYKKMCKGQMYRYYNLALMELCIGINEEDE